MAAQQPLQGQPAAAQGAMPRNGFEAIATAAGNEATAGSQQRRDPASVQADQRQERCGHRVTALLMAGFVKARHWGQIEHLRPNR